MKDSYTELKIILGFFALMLLGALAITSYKEVKLKESAAPLSCPLPKPTVCDCTGGSSKEEKLTPEETVKRFYDESQIE